MVGPIDVKEKEMSQLDATLTRVPLTLTFDLDLWPRISRSNCILGMGGKPLKLISSNYTWLTYGYAKIFWHPSRWPWVKVTKLPKRDAIYIVPMIKWEPLIQSLQILVGIYPHHAVHLIKFWRNSAKNLFFSQLFHKILNPFSPVWHFYLPYLRNDWSNWCETKRK